MNNRTVRGFAACVLPAILYACFIFFMSSLSAPPTPKFGLEWGDKVTHAGAFGLMALFTFRAVRWLFPSRSFAAHVIMTLAFTVTFGASDEIHQAFVPNRECDIFDWFADSTGGVLASCFIMITRRTRLARLLFGHEHRTSDPDQASETATA
ncbi:MAG: VanZ family protein [Bacteroidetes bacterium]|nr:VanZ family protein [Bacteroidota bacterium]